MTNDAYPRMTTEILRVATPATAIWWGIERSPDGGTSWGRLSHKDDMTAPGQPPRMWSVEELTCEVILDRWGDGLYRAVYYNHRRKQPNGRSRAFIVAAANEPARVDEPAAAPTAPARAAAVKNGRSNGHAVAHDDSVAIMQARAALHLETFMTVYSLVSQAEERRENQFQALMQAQIEQIKASASVDIARAEAASRTEIARVEAHTKATVESERDFAERLQDALEARSEESGISDELKATLEAFRARLEELGEKSQEAPRGMGEELILTIVENATPAVLNAIAHKMGIALPIPQIEAPADE